MESDIFPSFEFRSMFDYIGYSSTLLFSQSTSIHVYLDRPFHSSSSYSFSGVSLVHPRFIPFSLTLFDLSLYEEEEENDENSSEKKYTNHQNLAHKKASCMNENKGWKSEREKERKRKGEKSLCFEYKCHEKCLIKLGV